MPDLIISGLNETVAMLQNAPKNIVARGFVKALDAAGQVIVSELWPRTPIDLQAAVNKAHSGKGALVGKLDAFIELDSQFRGGRVEVGFGDLGHIANWVEYGHKLVGHGKRNAGKVIGKVSPHPFMRPAFEASAEPAIDAFAAALAGVLKGEI